MSDLATRARNVADYQTERMPDVLQECASALEAKDAEIARLTAVVKESLTTHAGIPAEDWAGMWNIANERANKAEAEVERVRVLASDLAALRAAVPALPKYECTGICASVDAPVWTHTGAVWQCRCGATSANAARAAAIELCK